MSIRSINILAAAERRANVILRSRAVAGRILPYEDGSGIDPLLVWSASRTPYPRQALVLQDWGIEEEGKEIGTVEGNVKYTEDCWEGVRYQPSFSPVFKEGTGSRASIESGETLLLNAIPGIRSSKHFKSSKQKMPIEIHLAALDFWLWVVTAYKLKKIWLAGKWARSAKTEFRAGQALRIAEYLDAQWPHYPVVARGRTALTGASIHLVHHPFYSKFCKQHQFPG